MNQKGKKNWKRFGRLDEHGVCWEKGKV